MSQRPGICDGKASPGPCVTEWRFRSPKGSLASKGSYDDSTLLVFAPRPGGSGPSLPAMPCTRCKDSPPYPLLPLLADVRRAWASSCLLPFLPITSARVESEGSISQHRQTSSAAFAPTFHSVSLQERHSAPLLAGSEAWVAAPALVAPESTGMCAVGVCDRASVLPARAAGYRGLREEHATEGWHRILPKLFFPIV